MKKIRLICIILLFVFVTGCNNKIPKSFNSSGHSSNGETETSNETKIPFSTEKSSADSIALEEIIAEVKKDYNDNYNIITESFELPIKKNEALLTWSSNSSYLSIAIKDEKCVVSVYPPIGEDGQADIDCKIKYKELSQIISMKSVVPGKEVSIITKSNGVSIINDNEQQYVEVLKDGFQTAEFTSSSTDNFFFQSDITAFATYNILEQNYFGIMIDNGTNKLLLYVDANDKLVCNMVGYALYYNDSWDFSATRKYIDFDCVNGKFVNLSLLKKGNIVILSINQENVFKIDISSVFASDDNLKASLISNNVHVTFINYKYVMSEKIGIQFKNIDLTKITDLTPSMKRNLTEGFDISFANYLDTKDNNSDGICANINRQDDHILFDFIGILFTY